MSEIHKDSIESYDITMYNVKDIQKIFRCGLKQAYELLNTNGFPSIKIGGRIMVEKKALLSWLEKNRGKKIITS